MNIKSILPKLTVCAIAIALSIGFAGCDRYNSRNKGADGTAFGKAVAFVYPDPPVSITMRPSLLEGYVLQLHNTSSDRHVFNVHVRNESKNLQRNGSFGIAPNDEKEVGILEMDWAFEEGEKGHVSVEGYTKKCYFEILPGGGYRSWYGL